MRSFPALVALALLVPLALPTLSAGTPVEEGVMQVVSFDGTAIDIIVCKPAGASASEPAAVILQSHGWGGSRAADCTGFGRWMDAGFGVVSISQRGFGASGGEAHIMDPDYEGRDMMAVIDRIAGFEWVMLEGPNDPVMAAIGGSYGGGYQFLTALVETGLTGSTRLDALSPEITWYDLPESLAPSGVVRTEWVLALYGVGAKDVHQGIHQAFAYGAATGQWPDGTVPLVYDIDADLHGNGPVYWVERGVQLDVPVLLGQGLTDNLFNLNQGWKNFENTLTPAARAQSRFIGYNGGHALPGIYPLGAPMTAQVGGNADPCSEPYGGYGALTLAFFENVLFGAENALPGSAYSMATLDGGCVGLDSLTQHTTVALPGSIVTNTGVGAPQYVPLLEGPATVTGVGFVHAKLTTLGADQRAFFGLARGTSPVGATVLDNNMMPVRALLPTIGEDVTLELAGVSADIRDGETLYLVVSPFSDMSFGHMSRAPGAILLEDVTVDVPLA